MNYRPLLSRLSIVDKDKQVVPLRLNWAQDEYVEVINEQRNLGKPVRIIILKARQLGMSTVTEGVMFSDAFIYDHMGGMVISHDQDSGNGLLDMTNHYWETYPFKALYSTKYASRNELAWVETSSKIKVQTAKNARAGRSSTLSHLHASEVAFWDTPEITFLGLRQTIPNRAHTFIVMESTANGVGNFFQTQWDMAVDGETEFIPLFYPWHRHPEYTAEYANLLVYRLTKLDDEERILRQAFGLSDSRLIWRRWAIKNLCGNDVAQFNQEYPSTPEEAFIASGRNVFPLAKLNTCYEPMEGERGRLVRDGSQVRFQLDSTGPFTVFKRPSTDMDWGVYFVGGDPTHTTRGDYACGQVISRRTLEQVAVYRGRTDPGSFGEELAKIGTYYNRAMVTNETEGPGYATTERLLTLQYPHLWQRKFADKTPGKAIADTWGWSMTMHSKQLLVGMLLKVIVDGDITIHDKQTYQEMKDYVTLDNGGYGNATQGKFDDTVTSLGIALTAHMTEGPLPAYGTHRAGMGTENEGSQLQEEWAG
jgi:hypothetical protein